MVCMQPVLYQTGESFFWISVVRPRCLARPKRFAENSGGLYFAILDSTLKWDKIEVLDLSFAAYCIDFAACEATEMKLQKHGYGDNSMGFLPNEFLYRTLLCQMHFKLGLCDYGKNHNHDYLGQ